AYDAVCGAQNSVTDLNNQITTTTYDALCRESTKSGPLGVFQNHFYVSFGNATTQLVQIETAGITTTGCSSGGGVTACVWEQTYIDGFGRTYKKIGKGPASGQDVNVDTSFDARGNTSAQSMPYYTGATVYSATTNYDALNRATKVTHPDGKFTTTAYGF